MGRGPSVRRVLLTAATLSLVSACASPLPPQGNPTDDRGPQRPTAVGGDPQVTAERLAEPILLDEIPTPLRVTSVNYNEGGRFADGESTLYADPDRADTRDGPLLIVGYGSGSACLPGPPESADTEDVDLGEYDGRLTRIGEYVFVGSYGNDVVSFVLARGVPEDEVVAAAATLNPESGGGADGDQGTALPPEAVPAGLAAVMTGPGDSGAFSDAGEQLYLSGGSGPEAPRVSVTIVRADPRLAALWGAWLDDPEGTTIRGAAGSAGPVLVTYCGFPAIGRVWAEDGLVFAVEGRDGADAPLVDAVAAGLRPGTDEELAALQGSVIDAPVTGVDAGCWCCRSPKFPRVARSSSSGLAVFRVAVQVRIAAPFVVRSWIATGSSQCGQLPPVPSRRQGRLQSGHHCSPR